MIILATSIDFTPTGGAWPEKQTEGAAGYDLRAVEAVTIPAGAAVTIPLGVAFAIPQGMVGELYIRSGLAFRHNLGLVNGTGIIDSDYRGEVAARVINHGAKRVHIEAGQRVAQILFKQVPVVWLWPVKKLDDTARGVGGFGSTGTH